MKIENYALNMNSQYYNLQQDYTNAEVLTSNKESRSDDSLKISNIEEHNEKKQSSYDKLSVELSKLILENINAEKNRSIKDTIEVSYSYVQKQAVNFQMQAIIQTDSKEVSLALDVSLSSSFIQHSNISIESLIEMKDPLVLSLNSTMPTLSNDTFSFDIDSDGKSDQISKLSNGNAFLALDKNGNKSIDNGSELFGTKSGDGFKDLEKYDEDKNGWIDENDAIFDKLRIWQKTDTQDRLIGLGEVGIGAIFLGSAITNFSLKSNTNENLGQMKSSGFFVYENGSAGVASQIDLVVNRQTQESVEKVNTLQKDISLHNIDLIYKKRQNNEENIDEKRLEELQKELKILEHKLSRATKEEQRQIQNQIDIISSQIMAYFAEKLT